MGLSLATAQAAGEVNFCYACMGKTWAKVTL